MFQTLAGLPVLAGATLFVGLVVLISVGGAVLFHRLTPHALLSEHNEIAGFVFAVVGVVYAVLLAFFAIGVWERFDAAEERTYDEASRLIAVYRKADLFPQGHFLRAELRTYTDLVINHEWQEMESGHHSREAEASAERIAFQVRHLAVRNAAQQNVHAAMIQSIDEALNDREDRTLRSAFGINRFLWDILIAGALATVLFAYLFAFRNVWSIVAIVGLLAFMLALVLYLIAAVNYPFRGEIRVGPEAFENALAIFKSIGP